MSKTVIIKMLRKYFDRSETGKYTNIVAEIRRYGRK